METGFSLGSNLGDRLAHLSDAKDRIAGQPDTRIVAQSPVYETEPVDVQDAYRDMPFLNAVLVVESRNSAEDWIRILAAVETDLGRVRGVDRNAPRPIDIDILYSDEELVDSGGLTVPHPRWAQRRFVAQPLSDVRPDLVLPGYGKTVREILEALPPGGQIARHTDAW